MLRNATVNHLLKGGKEATTSATATINLKMLILKMLRKGRREEEDEEEVMIPFVSHG